MNYTKLFYWLTVADNARTFFLTMIVLFTAVAFIATIAYFVNSNTNGNGQTKEDEIYQKMSRKWIWWSYPFMILFWMLYIGTPSKKDALLIVAGGQTLNFLVTDSSAKQIPNELSSFVLLELRNMAKDVKVDLDVKSQKEKILDEAKKLSSEELLNRIKTDSTFSKILLEE